MQENKLSIIIIFGKLVCEFTSVSKQMLEVQLQIYAIKKIKMKGTGEKVFVHLS